jgi:uncharacterized protein YabN with tetrapyrrole methylase and pyrophosphatase domain
MARAPESARRGSLVVVGTGIALVSHTTLEALAHLRSSEMLFYQVSDPATEVWLKRVNPSATTLNDCYRDGEPLSRGSDEVAGRIVSAVLAGLQVCAAFDGHPTMFVTASNQAVHTLRRKGFSARVVPGISALDCLFADLGVDPGDTGCQSFEATDFLAYRRKFDSRSQLILWQVGMLGEGRVRAGISAAKERLRVLTEALRVHYSSAHRIVLYEASAFSESRPKISQIRLHELPDTTISPMTTLFVPARSTRMPRERMRKFD